MVVFQTLLDTHIDYNKCTISRKTFLNFQSGVFHSRLILWSWQHSKYQQVQYLREIFFLIEDKQKDRTFIQTCTYNLVNIDTVKKLIDTYIT